MTTELLFPLKKLFELRRAMAFSKDVPTGSLPDAGCWSVMKAIAGSSSHSVEIHLIVIIQKIRYVAY
jgi:hypothetical protein